MPYQWLLVKNQAHLPAHAKSPAVAPQVKIPAILSRLQQERPVPRKVRSLRPFTQQVVASNDVSAVGVAVAVYLLPDIQHAFWGWPFGRPLLFTAVAGQKIRPATAERLG